MKKLISKKVHKYSANILCALFLTLLLLFVFFAIPTDVLETFISENATWSGIIFALLMFVGTVIPPITVFVLIPFMSVLIGPLPTVFYSVLGWGLGSMVAFQIARRLGRPFLARYMSLAKIDEWERKVPRGNEFITLLFLRIVTPVDFLSYALGLFSKVSFWKYSLASFLGVIPFSFVFAYGYQILFTGDLFSVIIAMVVLVVLGVVFLIYKKKNNV